MPVVDTMQIIKDACTELRENVAVRDRADKRIAELRTLLRTLVRFMPDQGHRDAVLREVNVAKRREPSLPEVVFDLLMKNPAGMTSSQIREALEQSDFDLDEYSQPLAAIMTVLSRMVDTGQVKRRIGKDKAVVFRSTDFDKAKK